MRYSSPSLVFTRRLRAAGVLLLVLAPTGAALAQLSIQTMVPVPNARAVSCTGPVVVTTTQPLMASSAGALKIYSAQRGGLRTRGTTMPVVSSNTVVFAPTPYPFMPGETVFCTITNAVASTTGSLHKAMVTQFTTATGGTGQGFFPAGTEVPVGSSPANVTVGDVDGDGDLDLLCANDGANNVSLRLNGGDKSGSNTGVFSGGSTITVGNTPIGLALGDVDGDGDLDLLTANFNNGQGIGSMSLRLNGGDATGSNTGIFSNGQDLNLGNGARSIVVGDVDGDGDLDALVANDYNASVSVLLNGGDNTGSNTGRFVPGLDATVGTGPRRVALGDADGDGDLDLFALNYYSASVSIRLNGGDATGSNTGTFSNGSSVQVGTQPFGLALGDIDGDGDLDLLCTIISSAVSVRLNGGDNTGSNTGVFSGSQSVQVGRTPQGIVLGDVDSDGDLDLVVANYGSTFSNNTVSLSLNGGDNTGSNTGVFGASSSVAVGSRPIGVALGDVDGDGDLDLLTANNDSRTVSVRQNLALPLPVELVTFTATLAPAPASGRMAVWLAWATATEKNSARFEVERSADGIGFDPLGTVPAAGSSGSPRTYTYVDAHLPTGPATHYYRLRLVDTDGTFSYSPVRSVVGVLPDKHLFVLSPNPAHRAATLTGTLAGTTVQVVDILGRTVTTTTTDAAGTAILALPTGLYVVRSSGQTQRLAVE